MHTRLASLAALLFALVAAPARADVLVVAPTSAPYAQVQTAVDAAVDGDVVLVKSGTYASFVVRNKEVAVVADAGALVEIEGAVRVAGTAATRTVVLAGLRATGSQTTQASTRHGLLVRNCDGPVRVIGCDFRGTLTHQPFPASCYEGQGAWIEACADVGITSTNLAGSTWAGTGYVDGGHGLYADASTLTLYDDALVGGRGGFGYGYTFGCAPLPDPDTRWAGAAGEGMRSQGGFCFASNSTFTGAAGWDGVCWSGPACACASKGGNGFVSNAGSLSEHLLACVPTPGIGGIPTPLICCELTCHNCSSASECGPIQPQPSFALVGAVTQLPGAARRLQATRVAREGQTLTLTFTGVPGDRVELALSDRTTRRFQAGWRGVWTIPRRVPQPFLQAGTIGPSGALTLTWPIGELGLGVQSKTFFAQALLIDAAGQTTFSSPATFVLLDAAF